MREVSNVRSTNPNKPSKIEVGVTTVYVRNNIQSINEEDFIGWQYDEIQYCKDEYIEMIANDKYNLQKENEELKSNLSSLQNSLDQAVLELTTVISMQGSGM
ncbi:hypothetical protein MHI39_08255 [Heyndrickxia sp. FSL K6-6286]|uniref:hypothetical protein n=1 Tax=Heyndrickxia sp. FSL K6-6286 TaxID=2921510 RepID=UPI00315A9DAE